MPPSSARNAAPMAAQAADPARIILRFRIRRPAEAESCGGVACFEPGTASNVHSRPTGIRARFPNFLDIHSTAFNRPGQKAARKRIHRARGVTARSPSPPMPSSAIANRKFRAFRAAGAVGAQLAQARRTGAKCAADIRVAPRSRHAGRNITADPVPPPRSSRRPKKEEPKLEVSCTPGFRSAPKSTPTTMAIAADAGIERICRRRPPTPTPQSREPALRLRPTRDRLPPTLKAGWNPSAAPERPAERLRSAPRSGPASSLGCSRGNAPGRGRS